ncbi:thioesterase II family protein [Streptomyces olindensis]|uniref:thioesterase II family protein n=1 Tax=Streptomyces olindensis TaxID=358823 RepID=UPI0033E71DB2
MPERNPAPRWLISRRERPETVPNLYVFAHAGGSVGEYLMWADDLPGLRVWGVQLPGRSSRFAETPYDRLEPLVDDLTSQADFRSPSVFLGHSFGALLAYETARALHRAGRPGPDHLLLSSCPPPHLLGTGREGRTPLTDLSDDDLLAAVEERWGPLSEQARTDPGLRRMVLRTLRSDMSVLEAYQHRPGPPLTVPATLLCGAEESARLGLDGWSEQLGRVRDRRVLPGGHFYFRSDAEPLLDVIRATARSLATTAQTGATERCAT